VFEREPQESNKPKLQLEYSSGGGAGKKPRTAIGTESGGGPELDRSGLADAPWWFMFNEFWLRRRYKQHFKSLSIGDAMSILRRAEVPPLYRIGLGVRWGFIIPDRDDFTVDDFDLITPSKQNAASKLDLVERRSTYQIWKHLGPELADID
jgi:hypothetical protein